MAGAITQFGLRMFLAGDKNGYARGYAEGKQIYVCAVCGKDTGRCLQPKKITCDCSWCINQRGIDIAPERDKQKKERE